MLDDANVRDCQSKSENLYYYNLLGDDEKYLYGEILYILENMLHDQMLSVIDDKELDRVFQYVQNDHPEIFYVEGYSYVRYLLNDEVKALVLSGTYNMTRDEVLTSKEKIDQYTDDFLNNLRLELKENLDNYNVIKYTYEYVVLNTEYDLSAPFNQSIISVMDQGRSVCQGYAKTMQYLLSKAGIESTIVIGKVQNGTGHAWNLVKADGYYYYIDSTWGDASYTVSSDDEMILSAIPPVNYEYLLVTDEVIKETHYFDEPDIMPMCIATEDNYYVKEGLLFDSVDDEHLRLVFDKAYDAGDEYIILKMTDSSTYQSMWTYLLEKQNIFEYLRGRNSVSYAESPEQCYMVFWI